MENVLDHQETTGKIYTNQAITIGTFIGGLLVAGYLLAENFKSLNRFEKIKPTWLITIFSTVLIFGFCIISAGFINISFYFIPLLQIAIAQIAFKKYQEKEATLHLAQGGTTHSVMRVLGVGVIGLLLTYLIMIIIGFFAFIAMDIMQ